MTRRVALSCEYPLENRLATAISEHGSIGDSLMVVKYLTPANEAKESKYLRLDLKWDIDILKHELEHIHLPQKHHMPT